MIDQNEGAIQNSIPSTIKHLLMDTYPHTEYKINTIYIYIHIALGKYFFI